MRENQNNQMTGRSNGRRKHLIIMVAACVVVLIALGIFLGYKLTKKDTPKESKDEKAPSSGEQTAEAGEWVLSKVYWLKSGKEFLNREYVYDEQGRLTELRTYDYDGGPLKETQYYSYDHNGEWREDWTPDKGGQLNSVMFTDMTGAAVSVGTDYETYQEEFYDDGYIKEFRVYWNSDDTSGGQPEKKLIRMVKWEYDTERKNIRRTDYKDSDNGELQLVDDLRVELDSEGRVVRCVNHGDSKGFPEYPNYTEYECHYEGNRRIETCTYADGGSGERVSEGNRVISDKTKLPDGSGWIEEYFYPNINTLNTDFWYPYLKSEIDFDADGTETTLYKVELTSDGQPLRRIELETGVVCDEYQYGSDGKLSAVLCGPEAEIKLDQYGNLVEYTSKTYDISARYEWIRLSDAKQPD